MKGYKAFDKDLKCRDFQYEVGKVYEIDGKLEICENGFHFYKEIQQCYDYYPKDNETRICEVEALGNVVEEDDKCCTNKILIVKELSKKEHNNGNIGDKNSGYCNTGCRNKGNDNKGDLNVGSYNEGDYNEGDYNKGSYNTGDVNKGNSNAGDYNVGNYNRGSYNKGHHNTGDGNEGYRNDGYYNNGAYNIGIRNKTNYACGLLNTKPTEIYLFNKPSGLTLKYLYDTGIIDDILAGRLTEEIKALPNFDINIWNEIMKSSENDDAE